MEHYLETLNRFRQHSSGAKVRAWVRYILAVLMIVFMLYVLSISRYYLAIPLAVVSLTLLFGQVITNRSVKRAFRTTPYCDTKQVLRFDEIGVQTKTDFESTEATWHAFTKAIFFEDGILLFRGENMVHWIPDSSLEATNGARRLRELIANVLPVANSS